MLRSVNHRDWRRRHAILFDLAEFRLAQKSNVCSKIAASLLLAVHAGRSSASHSVDNAFALALQSDGLFVNHAAPSELP